MIDKFQWPFLTQFLPTPLLGVFAATQQRTLVDEWGMIRTQIRSTTDQKRSQLHGMLCMKLPHNSNQYMTCAFTVGKRGGGKTLFHQRSMEWLVCQHWAWTVHTYFIDVSYCNWLFSPLVLKFNYSSLWAYLSRKSHHLVAMRWSLCATLFLSLFHFWRKCLPMHIF
jgi:hypothetical protein